MRLPSQKLLIDAAIEAGVKLFSPSEYVSDILGPAYAVFPSQFVGDKIKVRHYLEEKAAAGQIAYTALNGGPFFDMCEFPVATALLSTGPAFDVFEEQTTDQ